MKVYLVVWSDGIDTLIHGVFSSEEKAQKYIDYLVDNDFPYVSECFVL